LAAANGNVSYPANNETESNTRTQPYNPSTATTYTAAFIPTAPTAAFIPAASTTAIASFVKKVEKLNRTNIHNAKQTARETNETTGTLITNDAIEEYEYAYIRMRSYEIRAARNGFVETSANKFDLQPTRYLTEDEMDMINNEMKDETRRKNWLNEARAQLKLHT
jgi:hypothetical protein